MRVQLFNTKTKQIEPYPRQEKAAKLAMPLLTKDVFQKSSALNSQNKAITFGRFFGITPKLPKIFMEHNSITEENIAKLSKSEIEDLTRVAQKKVGKKTFESITRAAKILKSNLDLKYGKGNYVFISIGQSPAVFAELFKDMGVETAICPISNLKYSENTAEKVLKNPNIQNYFDYLKEIGLNPDKIKHDKRQYIFTDYCFSGESLRKFKKILTSSKGGYKSPNISFVPIQELLLSSTNSKKDNAFIYRFIHKYFTYMDIKTYSPSFRLPVGDIHLVQKYKDEQVANENFNMLKFLACLK